MGWTEEELQTHLNRIAHARQKVARTAQAALGTPNALEVTMRAAKPSKWRNKPVLVDLGPSGETVNGHLRLVHTFPSGREAAHYAELKLRRHAGEITDLRLQEPYALIVQRPDGQPQLVGEWLADFDYRDATGRHVVDAKGKKTDMYILKKKIVEACHAITIEEV